MSDHRDYSKSVLTEGAGDRKATPIFSGVLNYFPLAIAAVAEVSKAGNDQHNPGEPLHWARGKSMDHADCIVRHQIDYKTVDPVTGKHEHARRVAWRALAQLQELEEERLGAPISRGSSVEEPVDLDRGTAWLVSDLAGIGSVERRERSERYGLSRLSRKNKGRAK